MLKEVEFKKKEQSTKYHYNKLDHEEKFNQKTEEEKLNNIRKQNAEKKRKEQERKENIRRQNLRKEIRLQEEIRIQKEKDIKKQNDVAAKKRQEEKARIKKENLKNLRIQNEKKRAKQAEKNTNSSSLKRVNFLTAHIITSNNLYPIVRKPKHNSIIRSYRTGRNNRKGYKEDDLYQAILKHFKKDFDVLDNTMLAIGSGVTPYEPDIAMISKNEKNIYIDIEIDEPYAGVSRKLTHCYPEDVDRDNYFVDRGWFVIRFSEYQVHHQIEECLHKIVKVISAIDINFKNHRFFNNKYEHIKTEVCWNKKQAQFWELTKYRENYLDHSFKPFKEIKKSIDTTLTAKEKLEESLVKPVNRPAVKKNVNTNTYTKRIEYEVKKVAEPKITYYKKEFNSNNTSIANLIEMAINNKYAIEMKYTNWNKESSQRKVSNLEYTREFMSNGYGFKEHFKGFCHKRNEERSFKISRISYLRILN